MKKTFAFLLALIMLLPLCGCTEKGNLNLTYGESDNIVLSKEYNSLEWKSSDASIAKVENGNVAAVGPGQATITATNNSKTVAEYQISVSIVDISTVYLSADNLELEIDDTADLTYTLFPADASDYGITFTSVNPSIASVDDNGTISGLTAGTTSIILSTPSGITSVCEVTVKEPSAIEQLNEYEKWFFDVFLEKVVPSFYNSPVARIKKLGPAIDENFYNDTMMLEIEVQGQNKLGGTLFKDYIVTCEKKIEDSFYVGCVTDDGLFKKPHEWKESTKIDISKINRALEEYWEKEGMSN